MALPRPFDDDKPREECGVFGVFGHPDAAALTALGLHALQHRGQEAAGIVSFDGTQFHGHRALGQVGDIFGTEDVIRGLPGDCAIGHVRYATTGETMPAQRPAAVHGFRVRRPRDRPQRQPDQFHRAARAAGPSRLHLPVHDRHGGAVSPGRDQRSRPSRGPPDPCPAPGRRRLFPGRHEPQEGDRGARSAGRAAARDRPPRRRPDRDLRDLCARYHRRLVRARRGTRRDGGVRPGRDHGGAPLPPDRAPFLHLRVHLFRAARQHRRGHERLRRAQAHRRRARA